MIRKVHAPSPRNETWALCGKFSDIAITDDDTLVTCKSCLQTLGVTPQRRWCTPAELALIDAVQAWHKTYIVSDGDTSGAAESVLCAAVDAYEADMAGRRHYTG